MNQPPLTLCGSLSLHPSPLGMIMHNAGYRALSLAYTYVPFATADLPGALAAMRALGIRGFGISMPFKQEILPLLDVVDPLAARIAAVNTVVNDDGVLTGHNTDAAGAARALLEVTPLFEKRVVLLGAGGAARAVAHALLDEGARLHIANRDASKAVALAAELGSDSRRVSGGALGALDSLEDCDVLVNCTSAGMAAYGAASPVAPELLTSGLVVMDIVYKPVFTELLRAAAERGARTVHGGRMLLHQASCQFELYTGVEAPVTAMEAAQTAWLEIENEAAAS